jgi:hypothetical protein
MQRMAARTPPFRGPNAALRSSRTSHAAVDARHDSPVDRAVYWTASNAHFGIEGGKVRKTICLLDWMNDGVVFIYIAALGELALLP